MTAFSDETGRDWLPLKYEDGPDFCTVTLATGAAFALTVYPERMKLMEAALSASPVAQEPMATKATQQASADFLHEEMIKLGSPLTYTACLTLTKRITDTNTLAWAGEVNKLCTEIGSLKNEIAALKSAANPPATPAGLEEDWRDDPSVDERWQAGLDYGMERFCSMLGVDPKDVRWDAATEELDGDVCAVIGNILRVKFGDDFDPMKPLPSAGLGADEIVRIIEPEAYRLNTLIDDPTIQDIRKEWAREKANAILALLSRE